MKIIFPLVTLILTSISFTQQRVGGPCEGCEAIYETTVAFEQLKAFIVMPETSWENKKPLGINGVVYKADGKTPAANVVLYLYQTNEKGIYPTTGKEKGWAKRHGYIRGWLRTNEKGEYKFGSLRPAAYADRSEPAHIHVVIKEPGINEYYIDDFMFDDDPLLTADKRKKLTGRGGSGIVKLIDVGNMFKGERNIYLGKNIPHYPQTP